MEKNVENQLDRKKSQINKCWPEFKKNGVYSTAEKAQVAGQNDMTSAAENKWKGERNRIQEQEAPNDRRRYGK